MDSKQKDLLWDWTGSVVLIILILGAAVQYEMKWGKDGLNPMFNELYVVYIGGLLLSLLILGYILNKTSKKPKSHGSVESENH